MCGIAGICDRGVDPAQSEALLESMATRLRHRGPDDRGVWYDAERGLGLAHTRLSIVDLSRQGHQPMVSGEGRYRIVFNGEIYNFRELRSQLQQHGQVLRSESDTEVILASCLQWGLDGALERFNGMFAFALWDAAEHRLHLARDRVGEKPLYYGRVGDRWAFASELKGLRILPGFSNAINRSSLALLLRHGYIPAPYSIYQGIHKLPAGTVLTLELEELTSGGQNATPKPYWRAAEVAEKCARSPLEQPLEHVVDELDNLLREVVRRRLIADVPIGAFLSGGIDSSLVVALMQRLSDRPVKTFTIGFDDRRFDESPYAREVARHLGTDHTETRVTLQEAMALVADLPSIYDEPFADPSQIPTHLVSKLARQEVKVVLSGDGGDELFGGYHRYFELETLWSSFSLIPLTARRALARTLNWRLPLSKSALKMPLGSFVGKLQRLAQLLPADHFEALYLDLFAQCPTPFKTVLGAEPIETVWSHRDARPGLPGLKQQLMYLDFVSYLPEGILVKLDRASMRVNLEGRLPLLDVDLVEYAWRIPIEYRIREGQGKWMLRQVLDRYVPRHLVERPKQGFEIPIGDWLRGPLRSWAEGLLDGARLAHEGYFQPEIIERRWREHLCGMRDWRFFLWTVLMFQQWLTSVHHSTR